LGFALLAFRRAPLLGGVVGVVLTDLLSSAMVMHCPRASALQYDEGRGGCLTTSPYRILIGGLHSKN
jgi:hypothetical protein